MPDPGEIMGFPETGKCMSCHRTVKRDSAAIQSLAASARNNRPIPWVRVYEIPGYVAFSHKAHLNAGSSCETCHGPIAERDALSRETDISMKGCVDCHRAHKADLSCTYCHEERK
jgi:hypothetical protein